MTQVGFIGGGTDGAGSEPLNNDYLKCEICCAYDMQKLFTWTFVNGVRKVSKIAMSSAFVNTKHSINGIVDRDFVYQAAYPFDLVSIIDTLILV
jgi:hypothetical protein